MMGTKNICRWLLFACASLLGSISSADDRLTDEQTAFFENRIRPLLVEHCYECHSEHSDTPQSGLRLDLRQTVLRGGESGPAIVPGKPEESLLIEAVRYESLEMPPTEKLSDRAIADLVRWVEMGAPDPRDGTVAPAHAPQPVDGRDHWSFQPVQSHPRPAVNDRAWPLSDTDFFILSRLEREGLSPVQDADRFTWLRRASFDLTGLPPSVEEIRQFVNDDSPSAYETVVERLIASRAFGEHWARHWLDLVGYADEIGTSNTVFAEYSWRYRDYVIDSLNDDKPFDRFVREQIAGDLLPYATFQERAVNLIATGFLVLHDVDIVEADKAKLHVDLIDRQVAKTGKVFLGMTLACARCHDHKFDPIPQRDYYAVAGIFHSTSSIYKLDRGVWSDLNDNELPETESQQAERAERTMRHMEKTAGLKTELAQAKTRKGELDKLIETQPEDASAEDDTSRDQLVKERDELASRIKWLVHALAHAKFMPPSVPRAYGVRDVEHPNDMKITIRGNPRALGDEVPRGFLQIVSDSTPPIPASESGRRQLADWIASNDNPLTVRVAVNRIWQKLFGEGLVRSVDYFGLRGQRPSHPELLDYLAGIFIQQGWSRKDLIRTLVLSRTYRMSSSHSEPAHVLDPDNRLMWRMHRRRLSAEALRDAMLDASDRLVLSPCNSSIPLEYSENVRGLDPTNVNPVTYSLNKWRPEQPFQRTIYLPVIRSAPQPELAEIRNVFDFTQPAGSAGRREVTTVPTQALYLINSPEVRAHANALAEMVAERAADESKRLELLWLYALNRPITADEAGDAAMFLAAAPDAGWVELCHAVLASNEFLMRL
jgi:hypothetical protein